MAKKNTPEETVSTRKQRNLKLYPPPKNDAIFVRLWNLLIDEVVSRDNFKDSHLYQLEMLCDLYADYQNLRAIVEVLGYTFDVSGGRNGDQVKPRPEALMLSGLRSHIMNYSKMLGLILMKESKMSEAEVEAAQWE